MDTLDVYVVSDSLGETGARVVNAAISQFKTKKFNIRRFPYVYDINQLKEILYEASSEENAMVVYTIVDKVLIRYIQEYVEASGLTAYDLMTPLFQIIKEKTGIPPSREPGIIRKLDGSYFKKVEAIEFAVKYDDGRDPRGIEKADLVLVGISRTSKTPLSMYLANRNIKVTNVPLVLEVEPPKQIYEIPSHKVIGLTNSPEKLNEIRMERLKALGLGSRANYANMERILEELEYAERIMKRIGCPIIDVSNKAIEETTEIILDYLKKSGIEFD